MAIESSRDVKKLHSPNESRSAPGISSGITDRGQGASLPPGKLNVKTAPLSLRFEI